MAVWYSPGLGVAVRPLTASSSLHFLRDVRGSAVAVCPVNGYVVGMDVPTRHSYIMAIVRPEKRTIASGVTNLVRMAAWAVAPALAGLFMEKSSLATPLVIGAGLKIGHGVALYFAFRGLKPPEDSGSRS